MSTPRIGLALGAGGARGLAHIGLLQVLQEADIRIDQLAGTSAGAVVGAMYAETGDAWEIQNRFQELLRSDVYRNSGLSRLLKRQQEREASFWDNFLSGLRNRLAINLAQSKTGLFTTQRFLEALRILIRIKSFSECRTPFLAVATDLAGGREIPLCAGDLLRSVAASASIPGFFPPLEHHELVLNDGSVCCPVPVKYAVCQEPCIIVACGVPPRLDAPKPMDNAVEIMIRCEEINHYYLTLLQMSRADVQIYPEIGHVEWNEFDRMDELVEAGREAGRKALPQIRDVVQEKGSWLRRRFGRQTASRIVCERPLEGE